MILMNFFYALSLSLLPPPFFFFFSIMFANSKPISGFCVPFFMQEIMGELGTPVILLSQIIKTTKGTNQSECTAQRLKLCKGLFLSLSLLSLFLSFHLFSSSDKRWLRKILSKAMNWSLPKSKNFPAILNAHDTHMDFFFFKMFARSIIWCIILLGKEAACWRNLPLKCFTFVLVVLLFSSGGLGMGGCHRVWGWETWKGLSCIHSHSEKEQRNKCIHLVWKNWLHEPKCRRILCSFRVDQRL